MGLLLSEERDTDVKNGYGTGTWHMGYGIDLRVKLSCLDVKKKREN